MLSVLYTIVAVVVAWFVGFYTGFTLGKSKQKPDKCGQELSGEVVCGKCRTVISEPPLKVVLTDTESFRYYRCLQCGTYCTAPI